MQSGADENSVELCGTAADEPRFTHRSAGWDCYSFAVEVARLSGRIDRLNVTAPSYLLLGAGIRAGARLRLRGAIRSRNIREDERCRLILTVRAQSAELVAGNADPENLVRLSGSVCRAPVFRETPLGRRVCDVMLAVRRRYGRADFVPVILWGENAVRAGALVQGERICCTGRFQSREYVKRLPEGEETRVAFEVSAAGLCPAD
ncbi:MAG: single-stranded DNA-binding protein [Oscillospiraceae bacterium]|nr:single-stranded DNA-binding protein [Oscillospiraceae bacterium]